MCGGRRRCCNGGGYGAGVIAGPYSFGPGNGLGVAPYGYRAPGYGYGNAGYGCGNAGAYGAGAYGATAGCNSCAGGLRTGGFY
jgi:hypothetical protein